MEQHGQPGQQPLFPIGTVSRLTGVSEMTLRNWERRYGVPQPGRTSAGGQRLYAPGDVALVRHLAERVASGVPIRKAVAAVQAIQREPERLAGGLLDAALALDAAGMQRDLDAAAAALGDIGAWERILVPVLRRLGDRWVADNSAVAAEHLASSAIEAWLRARLGAAPPPGRACAVIGCGPGELHELGTLALMTFLTLRGTPAVYAGADSPAAALADLRRQIRPRVLVVTATLPATAERVVEILHHLAEEQTDTVLAYGGPGFDGHAAAHERLTRRAVFLGETLEQAVTRVEDLCSSPC